MLPNNCQNCLRHGRLLDRSSPSLLSLGLGVCARTLSHSCERPRPASSSSSPRRDHSLLSSHYGKPVRQQHSDTWGTAASLCFPGDIVAAGQVLRIMRCLNLGYGMLCTPHLPMICFICTHTHTPHLSSIFHGLSTAISNARETMRKGEHFLSGIMLR